MPAVSVQCPTCGRSYSIDGSLVGRKARCKSCGNAFALTPSGKFLDWPSNSSSGGPSHMPSDSSAVAAPLPERIARFIVKGRLGSGGFGTVYRAADPFLGREVAIKVPQPGMLQDPRTAERFLREARAAAQLRHPNIDTLYETGIDRGDYYIASEFIEGTTLAEAIEAGISPRHAAEITAGLATALQFAHAQGIVHRDVKPSNAMLDKEGQPHLMDFGLARFEGHSGAKLTQDGAIVGTPAYMAPEQAAASGTEATSASDQYSLGATLYELLTGEAPFGGPPEIVIFNLAHREPPPPRELKPAVPPDLETICLKAMAKSPSDRYANCQEFAEDLRRWLGDKPIRARRVGAPERFRRWARRKRMAIGAAVGLVIVGSILGALIVSSGRKPAETRRGVAQNSPKSDVPTANRPVPDITPAPLDGPPVRIAENDARGPSSTENGKDKPQPRAPVITASKAATLPAGSEDPRPIESSRKATSQPQPDPDRLLSYEGRIKAAYEACKGGQNERARAILADCPVDRRGWEWYHCQRLSRTSLSVLPGHTQSVRTIDFSPDGKVLTSGSNDSTVRVWSGQKSRILGEHKGAVLRVRFVANGKRIISVGSDGA